LAEQYFRESAAFINLGGIANITVVASGQKPVAYDIGSANSLLDTAVSLLTDGRESCDHDGGYAINGEVSQSLLLKLANHPYYSLAIPKTTGKETFGTRYVNELLDEFYDLGIEDILATLTWHVGQKIAHEVVSHGVRNAVFSGGGERNPVLLEVIKSHLGKVSYHSISALGIGSDEKEAYAFALLGFLTMNSIPATVPSCTGAFKASLLGSLTPGTLNDDSAGLPKRINIKALDAEKTGQ